MDNPFWGFFVTLYLLSGIIALLGAMLDSEFIEYFPFTFTYNWQLAILYALFYIFWLPLGVISFLVWCTRKVK